MIHELFFDTHRDNELEHSLNCELGDKIYSGHTNVMYSDHMKEHGHSVIKFMNSNREIEYHIHNKDIDAISVLHTYKIIHDDSKKHLEKGHPIKLFSVNDRQHHIYKKMAQRLIKPYTDKSVKDIGMTKALDGNSYRSHLIEGVGYGCVNWNDVLKGIK